MSKLNKKRVELFDSILNEADDTYKAKVKPNIVKESIDQTGAAFNLTKLKGYLKFETRWEYDEDYPEDAMLVDKVHEPPRFTVNWIGPEGKKHPNTYCVNLRRDRGESWTWVTHFCLKASDAAEMINQEVGVWEHNNMSWKFESKKALFNHLLNEDRFFKPFTGGVALTMAALTTIAVQSKSFDERCKAIADELGVRLDENAFDSHGAAYYMPYLQSFKYDGCSKDYGMTPEGLCKYIKKTADVNNVEYKTVEGGVEISFVDSFFITVGKVNCLKTVRGSFFVPDDYFGVSFIFDESKNKEFLFKSLLEAVEDFPKNTRAMYRFAKRRHDDTGAIRKVSKQPYWVHPEGVAKIVMEHGGSDLEIKAAMAHDVLEDTGDSYEDMVEKFGEKVASIVKEVTNDKDEIAKVGKEKYISEELCRLSPEALTVKLADMLYNMKDSPTEKNYERMRKNVAFLMINRQLDGKHLELAQEIMEV